jgi:hybrid cluster-associated redox disulfide protein
MRLVNINLSGGNTMTVDRNTIIGDLLRQDVNVSRFFAEIGMHCLGCPSARGETIEQACEVHDYDADTLIKRINDYLTSKGQDKE